jgi:hypothetical protein
MLHLKVGIVKKRGKEMRRSEFLFLFLPLPHFDFDQLSLSLSSISRPHWPPS